MCIPYEETFPFIPKVLTLWPWPRPLTYILISENLTYVITFESLELGVLYFICTFLVMSSLHSYRYCRLFDLHRDLWPRCLKTLTFAITFEPLVVGLSYFTCIIPWDEAFLFIPKVFTLQPWPWPLTHISEKFNIYLHFWTIRGRAFIFNMYIPCDEAFPFIPKFFTCVTSTMTFDLHNYLKTWNRK